jgi:DNA-binding response OmpR family regulator
MIASVLLAEDNLEQCFFFKKALKEIAPSIQFTEVHNGEKLMEILENYLPDILFLDLNMPCKNGMQCIQEIRENRVYNSLPIIVYSIEKRHHTIQTVFDFGANLYFVKPKEYTELVPSLKEILSMDWSQPRAITKNYFIKDKYIPFQLNS